MTYAIKICDSTANVLTVSLASLLKQIEKIGGNLKWGIFYVYATGDIGKEKSMATFEEEVNNSENGLLISWSELNDLASKFDQIYDILIVGSSEENKIKRYDDDNEMCNQFDIVLDLFDGAFWQVHSKEKSVIDSMLASYEDTEVLRGVN